MIETPPSGPTPSQSLSALGRSVHCCRVLNLDCTETTREIKIRVCYGGNRLSYVSESVHSRGNRLGFVRCSEIESPPSGNEKANKRRYGNADRCVPHSVTLILAQGRLCPCTSAHLIPLLSQNFLLRTSLASRRATHDRSKRLYPQR